MTPDELKKWREDHHVSQSELAELLGVHLGTIYRWEASDRTIPPYLALALETLALKLSPKKGNRP